VSDVDEYAGRSLAYVRTFLNRPPRFPTALDAAFSVDLRDGEPDLGAVVFYASQPWGHVGVYVGDDLVLTHATEGGPILYPLDDLDQWGGDRLGWVPAADL
jgi:cell wall-associated NlpC family hydrolase